MSLGEHRHAEGDSPSASSLRASGRVRPVGWRKIFDSAQFEIMDRSIGGQQRLESLKSGVEERIEGVLMSSPFCTAFSARTD
jgi:hypothetical protein